MTDSSDYLFDTVDAPRFRSLRSSDSVTETMCDAFFETRSSLENITESVQGAMNAQGEQPVQRDKAIEHDFPVSKDRDDEETSSIVHICPVKEEDQSQDLHRSEAKEYQSKPSVVTKPVGYLENSVPRVMNGKQEAVLLRSQMESESVQEAVSASQGKSVQPPEPSRLVQLETPEKNVIPMPGSRSRPAALQKNTSNADQGARAEQNRADYSTNLRSGYRQMSSSTDRQLQDRTPRRNVSGGAVPKGAHLFGSARFRRIQQTGIRRDLLLKNAVVPNEHGLHEGLNRRNVGLETVSRGFFSTPEEEAKERQSDDCAKNSIRSGTMVIRKHASRDNQIIRGPMNSTTKRRVCSACRVSGSDPVASSSYHSDTSLSSATRALDRLLKAARSPTRHPNSKRRTNDKRMVQLMARSPSANRLIPRPNMTKPARNQDPVNQLSTQQSSAAKSVAVQPSAQRRANHGPPHPRSSVILITPVKRGCGDGTPLRGFRTELRRYPIPTGSTPTHRPLTAFKEFRFHQKAPQNVGNLKLKRTASTAHGLSSSRRLSRKELHTLIERLAVPKRVSTTVFRTPMRIRNGQAHSESCVKSWGRCRSTSPSRCPASAKDHIVGGSAARALLLSCDKGPRCASIEPRTQPELH